MILETSIREKLQTTFAPEYLEVENESRKHHRPAGAETHFRVIVVSAKFEGQSRVDRQRAVMNLFDQEREQGLHALALRAWTPAEWAENQGKATTKSPTCTGHNH